MNIIQFLVAYFHAHPAQAALVGAYLFALVVDSMPEADSSSGKGYLWLYRVLHSVAANIKTARGLKMMIPQGDDSKKS